MLLLASGGLFDPLRRERDYAMAASLFQLAQILTDRMQVEGKLCCVSTAYLAYFLNNGIFHSGSPVSSSGEQITGHW